MQKHSTDLSIIIPAYNEAAGIKQTLMDLVQHPRLTEAEIIVIDDGSTDDTAALAVTVEPVKIITHRRNQGYGAAITTGIRHATGDYVIWYDSDGQHRPQDLLRIYDEMTEKQLDYCIGVRDGRSHHEGNRQLGKLALRIVVNIAAGQHVRDFNSGLRGFRRQMISGHLHLFPKGFSASTTTTLLMLERGYIGSEVDIIVNKRIGKSTVKQFRDGTRTLAIIMRIMLLFKPFRFFGMSGLVAILVGSLYGIIETLTVGLGFPVFGAVVIMFGLQTVFFGLLADQIAQMRQERLLEPDMVLKAKQEEAAE